MLFDDAEPGATLHHLHVLSTPNRSPLGLPAPDGTPHTSIYAIDAGSPEPADDFIAKVIMHAYVEATGRGERIDFAAVNAQIWSVNTSDRAAGELARQLQAQNRLSEHPDVAEAVFVYGAHRDGRRWSGVRWLTGSRADQPADIEPCTGALRSSEWLGESFGPVLLRVVGIIGVKPASR